MLCWPHARHCHAMNNVRKENCFPSFSSDRCSWCYWISADTAVICTFGRWSECHPSWQAKISILIFPWQTLLELSSLVSRGDKNLEGPTRNLCRYEQTKKERLLERSLWERDETVSLPNVSGDLKSVPWKYLNISTTIHVDLRKWGQLFRGNVQIK